MQEEEKLFENSHVFFFPSAQCYCRKHKVAILAGVMTVLTQWSDLNSITLITKSVDLIRFLGDS